jgi:N-carbamoyl-L-amino-acid hydrolase
VSFEEMWRDLSGVGRLARTGGYFRQPFTTAERECAAWFRAEATARDLRLEEDGIGNMVAYWGTGGDTVLTGSHLDSVLDGGAFDGPLGIVSAFAAVDLLRERGFEPTRRLGIAAFVEEEGSRFGIACLGSSLAVGARTVEEAGALTDRDGIRLADAWNAAGLDAAQGSTLLDGVTCYVELHVEQGRDLVDRGEAIAVASQIWPHGRYRFDFRGEANHAGATRMTDRHDPMLTYAVTALAAEQAARASDERATFGRLAVEPNGTNAVPSHVTTWLDARGASDESLASLVESITTRATQRARQDGTTVRVTPESVSQAVAFAPDLATRLSAPHHWPIIATQAGHDAGILSTAGIATAMLFVRNPTGVSHSPAEHAEMDDCLAGVRALADTLEELTR